ncbi:MAG: Fe-S cluster assembly ATPase SufC [Patescibacteria group bacterium]|jgi:Fe-S cluster assembly ATP-binding protein|nr:Fe-S cluster assembly ATPase SufC [Patescibacteria group bacterium]
MKILEIKNLKVAAGEKVILHNINFNINEGESVVIMGPNGSGKSTLANVLMGHPDYQVLEGEIIFKGKNITDAKPEERAQAGLFLSFQEPREIAGLELFPFLFDSYKSLRTAKGEKEESVFAFKDKLDEELNRLGIKDDWSSRQLNQDFSGGEKKKSELLQLALAQPDLAIFDEIDSGLDVDALEVAGQALKRFKEAKKSLLAVTHYQRVLKYIKPDLVIVMSQGKIVEQGGAELAARLEQEGFSQFK